MHYAQSELVHYAQSELVHYAHSELAAVVAGGAAEDLDETFLPRAQPPAVSPTTENRQSVRFCIFQDPIMSHKCMSKTAVKTSKDTHKSAAELGTP